MKPEQINEIITKVRDENNGMVIHTKLVQATEAYLLSHLETEGELVEIKEKIKRFLAAQLSYSPNASYVTDEIVNIFSPHLARLEGENQRLKGEIEAHRFTLARVQKDFQQVIDDDIAMKNQAVQAERDRIYNYMLEHYSPDLVTSIRQALQ